jgi:toxin HigB-1
MAIKSYRDRRLKRLFEDDVAKGLKWADKLKNLLQAIDNATEVEQLGKFPGWRLHQYKSGDWKSFWSVNVSGNWRLMFRFEDGDAFDLFLHDPH